MSYIRIKVKHLLIMIVAAAIILTSAVYFHSSILYMMGKISEWTGEDDRAGVYYDRAAEGSPYSHTAIAAAQSKLKLIFNRNDFGYFRKLKLAGGSTLLDGSYISADSADKVNLQYESIAQYAKKDDVLAEYTVYTALLNYFAGYGDYAAKLLKGLDYVKDTELKKVIDMNLAAVQMGLGNMEEGYETLRYSLDAEDQYSQIRQNLYAYYCFMKDDYEGFQKAAADPVIWYNATKKLDHLLLKPLLGMNNTISGYREIAEFYAKEEDDSVQSGNTFHGKAFIDGKPAAYAMVYLKDTNFRNQDSSMMGMHDGIRCIAVTDSDGSFKMDHVPDGIYGVGVSIDWQRIQGKALQMDKSFSLKFEGNAVINKDISFLDTAEMLAVEDVGEGKFRFSVNMPDGADYYTIDMGELLEGEDKQFMANNRFKSDRIDEAEYILDTAKERYRSMNTGASYSNSGIDPRYLFEPFYHTGDYAYYVTFYDKDGDILYDSNGIYPNRQKDTVNITGSQWSEADKLLLDKKYEEAIKLYETQLNDAQQDLHALKVLTKLYYNGWEYDEETSTLKNKDTKKAKAYFEKLIDSIKDNEQINYSLAGLYVDEGRFQEGLELLQRNKSSYGLREIAQVYGYMENFSKAEEYYQSFYEATGRGADRLMMLYILENRSELLPETAVSYSDNGSFYVNYVKVIQDYLKMDTTDYKEFFWLVGEDRAGEAAKLIEERNDDLSLLYKGLLLLQKRIPDYKEREKLYRSFYDNVQDSTIKQLLKYFGKEGIRSDFGDELAEGDTEAAVQG